MAFWKKEEKVPDTLAGPESTKDNSALTQLKEMKSRRTAMLVEVLEALLLPTQLGKLEWRLSEMHGEPRYTAVFGTQGTVVEIAVTHSAYNVRLADKRCPLLDTFYLSMHSNETEIAGVTACAKLVTAIHQQPSRLETCFAELLDEINCSFPTQGSEEPNHDGPTTGRDQNSV